MNRRAALAAGTAVVGTALGGIVVGEYEGDTSPAVPPLSATGTLLEDTDRETTYYELGGGDDGPTGVIIGGVHGDEVNGYRAAEAILDWTLAKGSLIVVPWADVAAIRANSREGPDGDLNRKFPAGEEPKTELARALWNLIVDTQPEIVVDLHRSRGIFETHDRWVGQAIFPTATGDALEHAETLVQDLNDEIVPRTLRFHRFTVGNELGGNRPMIIHKVGADLGTAGYIVELTEFLLDLETQVDWTTLIAARLLGAHGIERVAADR